MNFRKTKSSVLALACTLLLSACGTMVNANVTSFHDEEALLPGKTFAVIPLQDQKNSLEFKQYAALVEDKLQEQGYVHASGKAAYYGVNLRYGIDNGREVASSYPIYGQVSGGTTTYHSGSVNSYGSYGSGFGNFSGTSYTPAQYGVIGSGVSSHTEYTRVLALDIFNQKTDKKVYEGNVKSIGSSGSFSAVSKCLIQALFQKFPGDNGKTESLTLPGNECMSKE